MGLRERERTTVRKLREELGLSRPDFAKAVGMSDSTIESYEKEVPAESLEKLAKFARDKGLLAIADELAASTGTAKGHIGKDLQEISTGFDIESQFKEIHKKLDFLVARGKAINISEKTTGNFTDAVGRVHKTEADLLKAEKALRQAKRRDRSA